jgi:glycosyltransferase involved in cell wall biosynthesis
METLKFDVAHHRRPIIHVLPGLTRGGTERTLVNLLRDGLTQSFDNYVVSLKGQGSYTTDIKEMGVRILELKNLTNDLSLIYRNSLRQNIQPIVQGWLYHGNIAALLINKFYGGRLIWGIRTLYRPNDEKLLTQIAIHSNIKFSKYPNLSIFNSQSSLDMHFEAGFEGKAIKIDNGYDCNLYYYDEKTKFNMRHVFDINQNSIVFGHFARFHNVKRNINFVKAALKVAYICPRSIFVMAGTEIEASNRELVSLIPPEFLPRFRFLGERRDIANLLKMIDVFVLTSVAESNPNALGEAMASELPCISTPVGDAPLVGGDAVVFSPADNIADLAQHMVRLSRDQDELRARGVKGRRRIVDLFSSQKAVEKYADLYRAIQ